MSLVEVLIAITIFTTIFIPAYTLFIQSRGAVFKSKLALVSTLAAQEEAEDWRLLARAAGSEIKTFAHDWESVSSHKNALGRLAEGTPFPVLMARPYPPQMEYPHVYERIWTKLEVFDPTNGFVFPAVIHVRWQEKGETFDAFSVKEKEGFSRFEFYLIRPPRGT